MELLLFSLAAATNFYCFIIPSEVHQIRVRHTLQAMLFTRASYVSVAKCHSGGSQSPDPLINLRATCVILINQNKHILETPN